MLDNNKLILRVAGQIYGGWKEVNVKLGLEQIAGTFEISLTERWPNQPKDWVIPAGEQCAIEIGDDPVITGYVDSVNVTYDQSSHEIKISGRDATGDLVDCSGPSTEFNGLTFNQIAAKLCKPFGINVYDETQGGKKLSAKEKKAGKKGTPPKKIRVASKLPKQACQQGESVYKTLEKLARSEAVLLVSDNVGGLIITRAGFGGDCKTILMHGNIKTASYEQSNANLFSEITIKSQIGGAAVDQYDLIHTSPKGTVKRADIVKRNSSINRYRPLIIVAESAADAKRCQQRAEWEASNREAKARKVTVTVQGWREPDTGELWALNKRVRVTDPYLRLDEWWLIGGISFKLGEEGTTTELSLYGKNAFDELPEIPEPLQGAASTQYKSNQYKLTRDK